MHTALYRKKRPKSFSGIVGQQHVVQALTNQLETGQISHAYLFCGTRGTGKTSAAKIFARAVNCTAPQPDGPCNTCDICQSILADRCMDVVEIDAASNNSVDNIRDLREEVRYPPTLAAYKVYIVDEVHMLSTSAFNALLKTLEEPPPHVIFILATTDPQKIPATILSRCQRYDFKRISAPDMIDTMKRYLQAENVEYEDAALERIAYHSDGAMRDALSLLDQCLTLGDTALKLENVLKLLGAVDRQSLFAFTAALSAYDSAEILKIIDENMQEGRDTAQFTNDLVRHFRDVLVAGQGAVLDYSAEIAGKLKEQGTRIPAERLIAYIHAFSETLRELRFAPHMRTALEVCALRLCSPAMLAEDGGAIGQSQNGEVEALLSRLAKLERQVSDLAENPPAYSGLTEKSPNPNEEQTVCHREEQASCHCEERSDEAIHQDLSHSNASGLLRSARNDEDTPSSESPTPPHTGGLTPALFSQIKSSWITITNTLSPMLRSTLIRCGLQADGSILQIICDNESEVKFLKEKNRPLAIREALAEKFNLSTPPNLAFIVGDPYNKGVAKTNKVAFPETPPQYSKNEIPPDAPFDPSYEAQFQAPPQAMEEVTLEQMDWSDFGQESGTDDASPF